MDLAWIEKKEVREIRRPRRLLTITRHIVLDSFVAHAHVRGADVTCTTCKRYIEKNMVARARLHFPVTVHTSPVEQDRPMCKGESCMVCVGGNR